MLTVYLYIYFYNNTYTTAVCQVCTCVRACVGLVTRRVWWVSVFNCTFAPVMLHILTIVLMLFQEII